MIPHSRPVFGADCQQAVAKVVQSGFLACGLEVTGLEALLCQQLNRQYTLAVDSGTSALMLSIRALLGHKNGRVGIPAYACASLLFAVKAAGATPVLLDCTPSLTLDANQVWKVAKTLDVLILVHPFGMVEPLLQEKFPCPVIEDVAQAVGAKLAGQVVGSFADISIGSFYATKPWGGAYGGFVTMQDEALFHTIQAMTDPDQAMVTQPYAGHHQLSNIHACLAVERIKKASAEQKQRTRLFDQYETWIKHTPFSAIRTAKESVSNHFRYIIQAERDADAVIQLLHQQGIAASKPVKQPLHHAFVGLNCPQADKSWQQCVSLPMLADMSDAEFETICQGITTCLLP